MGWLKQTVKPCAHKDKPTLPPQWGNRHLIGDCWQCDECQKKFWVGAATQTLDMRGEPMGSSNLQWLEYEPYISKSINRYPHGLRD